MLDVVKRALARQRAVREEGVQLVERFGVEGAEVAFLRSHRPGVDEDERMFWRAVSKFAWRRSAELQTLDRIARRVQALRHRRDHA